MITAEKDSSVKVAGRAIGLGWPTLLETARRSASSLIVATPAGAHLAGALEELLVTACPEQNESPRVTKLLSEGSELGSSLPEVSPETRAWIEAGELYEKLLAYQESRSSFDFIFSLDPWSTLMLSRSAPLLSEAKWVYLHDLGERANGPEGEYWKATENWIRGLPLYEVIAQDRVPLTPVTPPCLSAASLPAKKDAPLAAYGPPKMSAETHQAWHWKRIVPIPEKKPRGPENPVVVVVKYTGRLVHFRVLLDSVARQKFDTGRLSLSIFAELECPELEEYLRYLKIAYPTLPVEIVPSRTGQKEADPWLKIAVPRQEGGVLLLLEESTFLPSTFLSIVARVSQEKRIVGIPSRMLGGEAAAHIVTGNLDPIPHYEKLVLGCPGSGKEDNQAPPCGALLLPPEVRVNLDPALLGNLARHLLGEGGGQDSLRGQSLVDLPPGPVLLRIPRIQ
jgi:hypothetical protein